MIFFKIWNALQAKQLTNPTVQTWENREHKTAAAENAELIDTKTGTFRI